jgi:hypothetical protein
MLALVRKTIKLEARTVMWRWILVPGLCGRVMASSNGLLGAWVPLVAGAAFAPAAMVARVQDIAGSDMDIAYALRFPYQEELSSRGGAGQDTLARIGIGDSEPRHAFTTLYRPHLLPSPKVQIITTARPDSISSAGQTVQSVDQWRRDRHTQSAPVAGAKGADGSSCVLTIRLLPHALAWPVSLRHLRSRRAAEREVSLTTSSFGLHSFCN